MSEATIDSMMGALQRLKDVRSFLASRFCVTGFLD